MLFISVKCSTIVPETFRHLDKRLCWFSPSHISPMLVSVQTSMSVWTLVSAVRFASTWKEDTSVNVTMATKWIQLQESAKLLVSPWLSRNLLSGCGRPVLSSLINNSEAQRASYGVIVVFKWVMCWLNGTFKKWIPNLISWDCLITDNKMQPHTGLKSPRVEIFFKKRLLKNNGKMFTTKCQLVMQWFRAPKTLHSSS